MIATVSLDARKSWYIPAALIFAGIVFSFWSTLQALAAQWTSNEDFSHGLLIVPIALYFAWERREQLKRSPIRTDWRAGILIAVSLCLFIVGELGAELFTIRVSMILLLIGSIWLMYGIDVLKVLGFPLAFLFLMLPLPGFIYRNITFPLQLVSSASAVDMLHLFGVTAYREGNVIDLGFTRLQVVEACNGLRFILPLLTLGVILACCKPKSNWKRAVLILATIPIAIFANVFRIGGTGIISVYWGSEAAEGFFHSFSGWAVFMVCFGLFAALNLLLNLIPEKKPPALNPPAPTEDTDVYRSLNPVSLAVCLTLIIAAPLAADSLGKVEPVRLKKPLTEFSLDFRGWNGRLAEMEADMWEQVGGQDYVIIDYYKGGQPPVNFYVAYYEYQRKAGDFIHSPKLCLPGAGWFMKSNRTREISDTSAASEPASSLKFNELVMQKNQASQLIYYWYQGRDRNFTSEYAAKFYMVWDGIWRRRTDGALVRLIVPLTDAGSVEKNRRVLDPFALAVFKELDHYLP